MSYEKSYKDIQKQKQGEKKGKQFDNMILFTCAFALLYFGGHIIYYFVTK